MDTTAVLEGLVEIIKAGGPLALWGIGIWLIFGILRVSVVCLVVGVVVKLICQTITANYKVSKETSAQRIHLLSQEVSSKLTNTLDSFLKESEAILKEFEDVLNRLNTNSKEK